MVGLLTEHHRGGYAWRSVRDGIEGALFTGSTRRFAAPLTVITFMGGVLVLAFALSVTRFTDSRFHAHYHQCERQKNHKTESSWGLHLRSSVY